MDDVPPFFFFLCFARDGSVDSVDLDVVAAADDVLAVVASIIVVDLVVFSVFVVVASATFVVADVSVAPSVVALFLGDWGLFPLWITWVHPSLL